MFATTPHSIGDPPRALHFRCFGQTNWQISLISPLSYATAECSLYVFLFLRSEGGHGSVPPPPYASVHSSF